MTLRRITPRIRNGGFGLAVLTSVVFAAMGAGSAGGGTDAKGPQRLAYRVAVAYTLTRDAVDPASGQHTTVERRLEAEFRVWAKVNEDQVYTGTTGDYAEVDGKTVATVRDNRITPA